MSDILKLIVGTVGAVLVLVALILGTSELGFKIFERYNPKFENVRRNTYEQSRAYREGTVRDLQNLAMEYTRGNEEQKAAIRITALHRFADVPDDILTPDLRQFRSLLERH